MASCPRPRRSSLIQTRSWATSESAPTSRPIAASDWRLRGPLWLRSRTRGWTLVAVHEDALSGKSLDRPGLAAALAAVEAGEAGGIVVAKLDRLSRSLKDFACSWSARRKGGWNLVACDLGIDLSTPAGEFMANVMGSAPPSGSANHRPTDRQ